MLSKCWAKVCIHRAKVCTKKSKSLQCKLLSARLWWTLSRGGLYHCRFLFFFPQTQLLFYRVVVSVFVQRTPVFTCTGLPLCTLVFLFFPCCTFSPPFCELANGGRRTLGLSGVCSIHTLPWFLREFLVGEYHFGYKPDTRTYLPTAIRVVW